MLTQARLKELLRYDADTGAFTWVLPTSNRVKAGDVCSTVGSLGYIVIGVDGKRRYAHRLAWLYVTGEFPSMLIDHVNGIKSDNRWANLRLANKAQNMRNAGVRESNTSGHTGVSFHKMSGKWRAYINKGGKTVFLGLYETVEQAVRVRQAYAKSVYGDFYHRAM